MPCTAVFPQGLGGRICATERVILFPGLFPVGSHALAGLVSDIIVQIVCKAKGFRLPAAGGIHGGVFHLSVPERSGLALIHMVHLQHKTIGKYKTGSVVVLTRKGSNVYVNGKKAGREVLFAPARNVPGFLVKGNKYRGDMKAIPSSWGNGITLINVLPMEDYLKGVVPSEIVPSWRMDAIKAQAVAARTYATYHRNGYRSSGYDVTDDTRTQVYRGFSAETAAKNRAVSETAGEGVTYAGKPIDALFHSSGGGFTENSENVWGSVIPYLRGVKEESSTYLMTPWKKTMTMASFTKSLENAGYKIGDLKSIKLSHLKKGEANHSSDRGISGRVKSVVFVGKKGRATVSGERLQRLYGLDSTLFDISAKGKELTITGYGYGHGLGLSQWGAEAMAEKHGDGKNYYKTILSHYFTGTKIEKIY